MSATSGLEVTLRQRQPVPLNATFSCAPGELLALVGPSGSGKTTVLRAISGLSRPQAGRIRCDGRDWFDPCAGIHLPPQRRRAGLVFQDYALFPHLSAVRNVALALGHLPRAERGVRARALLASVHLAGLEGRRPADLSGGQAQRVALARALARDPAVLLLDEPFSAVDQITRRRLRRELAALRQRLGCATVMVTHDLDEALELADRMVVLHRGETLQTGVPAEMMRRPANALVARLLDQRNLFAATVVDHADGATWIDWAGHRLQCAERPDLPSNTRVDWMIPASGILLHRRDRPSRGERENPVKGRVSDLVSLGETLWVTLQPDQTELPLRFRVPEHVARRNGVEQGAEATVSLLADSLHLMMPVSGG
jgi:molybdate transport system ATP-binding protein